MIQITVMLVGDRSYLRSNRKSHDQ